MISKFQNVDLGCMLTVKKIFTESWEKGTYHIDEQNSKGSGEPVNTHNLTRAFILRRQIVWT